MIDAKLIETGNGGDVVLSGNDLAVVYGFVNMPYLALFGGNVAENTPEKREDAQQLNDWWGNALLMPNDVATQFNSNTERTLMNVALNSAGRILIEQAVNTDLDFMRAFCEVTATVDITGNDRVQINIKLLEPDNLQAREFVFIWDGTLTDLTEAPTPYISTPSIQYPINIASPVISGLLTIGSLLSCTTGTWLNSPTSYSYQWRRDGVNIGGATSNTYTLVTADAGCDITCKVTAVNSYGSAFDVSNILSIACPVVSYDIFIKGYFGSGETDMDTLTIDSDSAGTYTSITDDGSSGSITISKNGGAYGAFSSPLVLAAADTLDVKRTVSTSDGYFKLTGTY